MFGRRITLFTIFGIRVGVDPSWILLALLIAWSLAQGFFPSIHQGLATLTYWWMGLAAVVGLFASLVAHELMHSVVGRATGTPIRGITLFILGGVAEMESEPPSPAAEFVMAIVGPITSAVIAGLFFLVEQAGRPLGLPAPVLVVASYLAAMNALLAGFNIIPAYPLDGGRVLRAVLWKWRGDIHWATRIAAHGGELFGWLLVMLGLLSAIRGDFVGGLWWLLIGFFVRGAARASLAQMEASRLLKGLRVRRYMTASPVTVPPAMTVRELVEERIYTHHFDSFPVVEHGRLVGSVGIAEVKAVPRERWETVTVGEIATAPSPETTIDAEAEVTAALALMQGSGRSRLLVTENGRLAGVVVLKDLLELLALRLDLEG